MTLREGFVEDVALSWSLKEVQDLQMQRKKERPFLTWAKAERQESIKLGRKGIWVEMKEKTLQKEVEENQIGNRL